MKVQFVFSSFLVCSLVGELFGELVDESDFVVLDNADTIPERRAAVYDPGCVKAVPDSKAYPRPTYPRRNPKYLSQKSSPYSKKFPRYQDNYSNSPAGGPNNFKNLPDFGSYPYSGKRFPSNSNGKGQRYPFRPMKNFGTDGPFAGADKGKRNGKVYMMSLRDNKGREVYRRMLDAAEEEEEDELEEPQDY